MTGRPVMYPRPGAFRCRARWCRISRRPPSCSTLTVRCWTSRRRRAKYGCRRGWPKRLSACWRGRRARWRWSAGVRELMQHEPFKGRRPLFIGDDVTDETVFAIMPDLNGLAFSVGRRAQGVAGHFDEPSDVRAFLAHLLDDEALK